MPGYFAKLSKSEKQAQNRWFNQNTNGNCV